MKRLIQILFLAVSTAASAQNGFVPVLPGIGYSEQPVNLQGTHSYAYVRGHWVPLDNLDKRSELAGPSISEISCDYQEKTCHEQQANILVMGNDFDLTVDSMDYPVVRWNSKEIVAQNISGSCRVLNTLKFDLVQKRVYFSQTLSEPTNDLPEMDQKLCTLIGMNLELKAPIMWRKQ